MSVQIIRPDGDDEQDYACNYCCGTTDAFGRCPSCGEPEDRW